MGDGTGIGIGGDIGGGEATEGSKKELGVEIGEETDGLKSEACRDGA